MNQVNNKPDFLFEISWEVCNKIGGIHTVVSTKAVQQIEAMGENYVLIAPDVWRETERNPEFIEDKSLFSSWQLKAFNEGLRVRAGYWNIPQKPKVIMVDFTPLINEKNEIFAHLWEKYQLNSLSGQWDYIEAALFGMSAGKVIESFKNFNLRRFDKVVAHFHEWMTGSGILYLKEHAPAIATVFTTHATVVGRSIAGNGLPLYKRLKSYNGDKVASDFNLIAKQSLEKLSARTADSFTTVSNITAQECSSLLDTNVDVVTPNGFDDSFVAEENELMQKRENSRDVLKKVAEVLTGKRFKKDVFFLATSGRYEYKNKGLDLFIDALEQYENSNFEKEIVAFILVPANNYGARKDISKKPENSKNKIEGNPYLTHNLHDVAYDPVIQKLNESSLKNSTENKVNVVFVPAYLNGEDGIFDISYFDLITGLDLTVFASYYEPWGYTPMESLAFGVPTVTTSLAGFGKWIQTSLSGVQKSVFVINRDDTNDAEVSKEIMNAIIHFSALNDEEQKEIKKNANLISTMSLWKNHIRHYYSAYEKALASIKPSDFNTDQQFQTPQPEPVIHNLKGINPVWKKALVRATVPDHLEGLYELSRNLWWSWNTEAKELFESIEPELWAKSRYNPIAMLEMLPLEKIKELETSENFRKKYQKVYSEFISYINVEQDENKPHIAYFSMEYGLHDTLKIYSGGLGILAGDYLKEASDSNVHISGIGLLYRHGYFKQKISLDGSQIAELTPQKFSQLPIVPVKDSDNNWLKISIALPGRNVEAKLWQVNVGRVNLYLLDTDIEENSAEDRSITHQLYGGFEENRFKQEMILGVGGIRVIEALKLQADLYHCNEGHAAFIGLERLRKMITTNKLSFDEAIEVVRSSTLFTTHTPVPAGHDAFHEDLVRKYMSHYPSRLKIDWHRFISLGRMNPENPNEKFSMSHLAANLSQEINGVSMLHGKVSREMFRDLWQAYMPEELALDYVTNGVHLKTWAASEWMNLYSEVFGNDFDQNHSNHDFWNKIHEVDNKEIWGIRMQLKKQLIDYVRERIHRNWIIRHENPQRILEVQNTLSEKKLTIGFARRFATYKRAKLLFTNLNRLEKIINNPDRPVQFIFAGKAHPNDGAGQDLIKYIVEVSRRPEFSGKIIFLENYDIQLAQKLVQGVDIWMNTPTRPLEASGTSGMKAIMNGVLNFSVLDGWWLEGYRENAGWAISEKRTYQNQEMQNSLDAEIIYSIIENEITPAYYNHQKNELPNQWIGIIKNSIAQIAPEFTTKRMIDDYLQKFYIKQFQRTKIINKYNFENATLISEWKKQIRRAWETIEILDYAIPGSSGGTLNLTDSYKVQLKIYSKFIDPKHIGVELVITNDDADTEAERLLNCVDLNIVSNSFNEAVYELDYSPEQPGMLKFGLRLYPKHELLPHRQDFPLARWVE